MDFNKLFTEKKLRYIGRTYIKNDMLYMNFSGSGIEIKIKSKEIKLVFTGTKWDDFNSCPYVCILIDGERYDYAIDEKYKSINISLDNNVHNVKILKRTESSVSHAMLVEVYCDELLEIDEEDKLKIEFYGDSITCGYGSIGNDPLLGFTTKTESFLDSYAYLTSKKLNAYYSAVCVSGFPIYKSRWNLGFPIESVADMISISDYSEDMTFETAIRWDNKKYIPDIVVVNLGTNDCSYFTEGQDWVDDLVKIHGSFDEVLTKDEFISKLLPMKDKIHLFLDSLFKMYGDIKIVWALNMIFVNSHIDKIVNDAIKEYNNPNVYNFKFHSLEKSKDFGTNWHPGKTMHKDAADELSQFILDVVLGGDK